MPSLQPKETHKIDARAYLVSEEPGRVLVLGHIEKQKGCKDACEICETPYLSFWWEQNVTQSILMMRPDEKKYECQGMKVIKWRASKPAT